jgi:hypothetical protein
LVSTTQLASKESQYGFLQISGRGLDNVILGHQILCRALQRFHDCAVLENLLTGTAQLSDVAALQAAVASDCHVYFVSSWYDKLQLQKQIKICKQFFMYGA